VQQEKELGVSSVADGGSTQNCQAPVDDGQSQGDDGGGTTQDENRKPKSSSKSTCHVKVSQKKKFLMTECFWCARGGQTMFLCKLFAVATSQTMKTGV